MLRKLVSIFRAAILYFASTKIGFYILSPTLWRIDRLVVRLTGSRTSATSILTGLPLAMVTVIGAKSGKPRTIPLLPISDTENPDTYALIASNWGQRHHPAWYHNLKANPEATIGISGKTRRYKAHEAEGEEYDHFMNIAKSIYPGYATYVKRAGDRHIPVMVMTPLEAG